MTQILPDGAVAVHDLWPEGPPADFVNLRPEATFPNPDPRVPERWVRNVTRPTLTHFPAKAPGRGISVLVVPGGAFHFVSIDNEGYDVARALAQRGVDAFVLKYRVFPMPETDAEIPAFMELLSARLDPPMNGQVEPPLGRSEVWRGRELAEEDGRQAMRLLKSDKFDIDPKRLGVIGFSAGGGVAVDLALAAPLDCVPAFAAPVYPAYRPVPVRPGVPPMFLSAATDDGAVAPFSTARLAELVHRAGGKVALHLYGTGGHGYGIRRQGNLSDRWFGDFCDWLDTLSFAD